MRAVFEDEVGTYEPPRVVKFGVPPPRMDSRRSAGRARSRFWSITGGKWWRPSSGHSRARHAADGFARGATFIPASLNRFPSRAPHHGKGGEADQ
jgi:hypothetical protein